MSPVVASGKRRTLTPPQAIRCAIHAGEVVIAELAPQTAAVLKIYLPRIGRAAAEYHIIIESPREHESTWAAAGPVVTRGQLTLAWISPSGPAPGTGSAPVGDLAVEETTSALRIVGPAASVIVERETGRLESYRVNDRELIARLLAPAFWHPLEHLWRRLRSERAHPRRRRRASA